MVKTSLPPTLFEVMRVLTAEQRQRLGVLRRKMNSMSDVKERLEMVGEQWVLNYYSGKKKVAEVKIAPQELEFNRF